jgi:putative colanic acid biosysnthesis UDP-glucose lipid carrier transferase
MKKRFYKYFPWLFLVGELVVVFTGFFLFSLVTLWFWKVSYFESTTLLAVLGGWSVVSLVRKDYKLGRTADMDHSLKQLFGSLMLFAAIILIVWSYTNPPQVHLLLFGAYAFSVYILLGIYRVGVHLSLKKYRARGFNYRNAVIIGKGGAGQQLADVFRRRGDFGIKFLGFYDDISNCFQTRGLIRTFFDEAEQLDLDLIYINSFLDSAVVKQIIDFADENYIKVKMIPGAALQLEKNLSFSKYGEFFVINVNEIPLENAFNRILKRVFDLVFSLLVTVFILSWLIPLVGILIKLESKGSVFFIQERNGENNRVFRCLKFRSMTPNDYSDSRQATKNDPRVTRIGALLRTTSLDEMPQFLNVLIGDMSIVGPRPHSVPMNKEFKKQIGKYNSRHKIKPGITGLAQVKGYRGEIDNPYKIKARVRLDSFYIKNWSIWMDLDICIRTVYELIFNRENAY